MRGGLLKKYTITFVVFATLLLLLSIFVHQTGDFQWYRAIRGLICFSYLFLLLYLKKSKANRILVFFLCLYGVSSFLTIWYEQPWLATLSMALNFVSFVVLIAALFPKVSFKKMNVFFIAIFTLLVLLNAYLLYEFVVMMRDFALGQLHYFLLLLGAMSLVVTGFMSLLYNHKFSSKATLVFTSFVFVLVFAEVFRAIAYYNFAYGDISVYVARALLLLGMSLIVYFDLIPKKTEEVLGAR